MDTLEASPDIFFDVWGVVDLVRDEDLFSGEGKFVLIRDFLSIFIFQLSFDLEDQFKRISDGLFIISHIEMGVACVGSLHNEIVQVELLVIGPEIRHPQTDQRQEVTTA